MSFAWLSVDWICPRCGHCGGPGPFPCANCEMRGREAVPMRPRTREDADFGVPEPLFFLTPEGGIA